MMAVVFRSAGVVAAIAMLCIAATGRAQTPDRPPPVAEHDVLGQFTGEWEMTGEIIVPLSGEVLEVWGTESARMLGEFWLVSELEYSMAGMDASGLTTIGYDSAAGSLAGSYISSLGGFRWEYEGEVDESGRKLTLETEGPSPLRAGETARFRETLELRDKNHKVFTSSMQDDEGRWVTMLTWNYRREKERTHGD
jgi:hypothetical protein